MLTKSEKIFSILFAFIVLAELIVVSSDGVLKLECITKPAIVISLLIFFWIEANEISRSIKILTLFALTCSLLGDVLLMFVDQSPNYFMFGLLAFLIAHILYILVFLKHRNPSKKSMTTWIILWLYAIIIFSILRDNLGEMFIPVLIYILVILMMGATSFLRDGRVSKISYNFVCIGAIFFLISDSVLAMDKFYKPIEFANILIMLTYALAQYFIALGIKKA